MYNSTTLNLSGLVLWPSIWAHLVNVLCSLEKNIDLAAGTVSHGCLSERHGRQCCSIFCFLPALLPGCVKCGMLMPPTVILEFSISSFNSTSFNIMYIEDLLLGECML